MVQEQLVNADLSSSDDTHNTTNTSRTKAVSSTNGEQKFPSGTPFPVNMNNSEDPRISETTDEGNDISDIKEEQPAGKDIALEVEETENVESDEKSMEEDGLPIDRGWAWMVLAGSFLNVILMIGYGRSIGILFVEYLEIFEASTTKTTLFMGVMAGTFSIASLISMNLLLQILGVRKLVLLGGVITSLGMLTGVFATSITFLICTHSILIGLGHSMIHGPALVLIGQYFKKRRGLATAFSMSGFSFGASIFPPLIRYFIDEYGVRGSMLLLTGLTMNMLVGALLYRPLDSFRKHGKTDETKRLISLNPESNINNDIHTSSGPINDHLSKNENQTLDTKVRPTLAWVLNSNATHELTKSQLELYKSNLDLASVSLLDIQDDGSKPNEKGMSKKEKTFSYYMKMLIKALDFSLFKHPMFQIIVVTSVFASVFVLASVYLPALAGEKGIPANEASILLTILGCVDFVSRLSVGYIADLKRIKVHHLIAIGLILSGTVAHFASLYNSFDLMIVLSVLIGMFGSFYSCLIPVFIVVFMGQKNMAKVLGFVLVVNGLTMSLTHPILGAIHDLTGSYTLCFNYIGASAYIGAICLVCEPLARRRARRLHLMDNEERQEAP